MLPQINADQRRKNLRNSATSAGDLSGTVTTPTRGPTRTKKMLPQINADQPRNNLRNSATSEGDLSGTVTTPTRGPTRTKKCSRRLTRISAEKICGILRHLRETMTQGFFTHYTIKEFNSN